MEKIFNTKYQEILDIKEKLENEYDISLNIIDINELIDIIVKWYEFKYSEGYLQVVNSNYVNKKYNYSNDFIDNSIFDIDELHINMGYTELMHRIPKKLYSIIECFYQGEASKSGIKLEILRKKTNKKTSFSFFYNKYDGKLDIMSMVVLDRYFKINVKNIYDLLKKENYSSQYDYSMLDFREVENAVKIHNLNLELRRKIFEYIILRLFDSHENKYFGYIRAKKFIEEFNLYIYDLNLSIEYLNNLVDNRYIGFNRDYFSEVFDSLASSKSKSIEDFGLSFETIKYLKENGIYDTSINKDKITSILNSNQGISCDRDKVILNQLSWTSEDMLDEDLDKSVKKTLTNFFNKR